MLSTCPLPSLLVPIPIGGEQHGAGREKFHQACASFCESLQLVGCRSRATCIWQTKAQEGFVSSGQGAGPPPEAWEARRRWESRQEGRMCQRGKAAVGAENDLDAEKRPAWGPVAVHRNPGSTLACCSWTHSLLSACYSGKESAGSWRVFSPEVSSDGLTSRCGRSLCQKCHTPGGSSSLSTGAWDCV